MAAAAAAVPSISATAVVCRHLRCSSPSLLSSRCSSISSAFLLSSSTNHLTLSLSLSPRIFGPSSRHYPFRGEKKKGKNCRNVVVCSLFGVGAPEALVIGVVALLVFGPKGLAEVARNLGKTLRAFQPTIRELQEVSREFKSTLEREIGLDEVTSVPPPTNYNSTQPAVDPNGKPAYTSEELLKVTEEQLSVTAVAAASQETNPPSTTTTTTTTTTTDETKVNSEATVATQSPDAIAETTVGSDDSTKSTESLEKSTDER